MYAELPDYKPNAIMPSVCDIAWDSQYIGSNSFQVLNVGNAASGTWEGADGWDVQTASKNDGDGALGTIDVKVMRHV